MTAPVRVGLVGAGPWAQFVHAPTIAAFPETELAGIWARRPEPAAELATRHGAPAFEQLDNLFAACDAVVFSVPPGVQAELAVRAARAGKALLLEKPIAASLAGAETLAGAVSAAGVPSLVALTWRYAAAVRRLIDGASAIRPIGGRGVFVSGGFLPGSPFATPWRLERGPLLDLGPHVIDLLDAALGRVTSIEAHGDLNGWVGLLLGHEGGARSEVSLCATAAITPHRAEVELFGAKGSARVDCTTEVDAGAFATMYGEFAAAVRSGRGAAVDVHRGVHIQGLIEAAEMQLAPGA